MAHHYLSHPSADSNSTEISHEWSDNDNDVFDKEKFSDDDNYGDWNGHSTDESESNPDTLNQATKPFIARENSSTDLEDLYASIDVAPVSAIDPDIRFTLKRRSRFGCHPCLSLFEWCERRSYESDFLLSCCRDRSLGCGDGLCVHLLLCYSLVQSRMQRCRITANKTIHSK